MTAVTESAPTSTVPPEPGQLLIAAAGPTPTGNRRREVLNPATGESFTTVAEAGTADVARATARQAFDGR